MLHLRVPRTAVRLGFAHFIQETFYKDMYKNQLQELAQRSCFNLPSYFCIREGPDHAPRFKAVVTFNGETFDSPKFYGTLRQAEHAAAEVALSTLSRRGPSQSLAAKILDETSVCKNLLQEMAQRAGVPLPSYTTTRSGPGHLPVFACTVEVAGMTFAGEVAKSKKQAEKNAAMVAWSSLKKLGSQAASTSHSSEKDGSDELEQNAMARLLSTQYTEQKSTSASQSSQNKARVSLNKRKTYRWNGGNHHVSDVPLPFNTGGWVTLDFKGQAIPSPNFVTSPHNEFSSSRMFLSPHALHEGQNPVAACGPPLEIIPSNRLICSNSRQMVAVPVASSHTFHHHTQEGAYPLHEHHRDEEEWTRSSGSSLAPTLGTIRPNMPLRAAMTNTVYDYAIWSHPAHWINIHTSNTGNPQGYGLCSPVSLAPPVRVRSSVAVSSAPPRRTWHQEPCQESSPEQAETQVLKDISALKLD